MDSMDIDIAPDPNELYYPLIKQFGTSIDNALNDNDYMLDLVLLTLAHAVPDSNFNIDLATIQALRMNDLRNLLISGNYDQAACEVLRRCIAQEWPYLINGKAKAGPFTT